MDEAGGYVYIIFFLIVLACFMWLIIFVVEWGSKVKTLWKEHNKKENNKREYDKKERNKKIREEKDEHRP